MKVTQILNTYAGSCKNYVDIEVKEGLVREIPFFNEDGKVIGYDEALEIYGEVGLAQDIWDNEKYLSFIEDYIKKNNLEIEEI